MSNNNALGWKEKKLLLGRYLSYFYDSSLPRESITTTITEQLAAMGMGN